MQSDIESPVSGMVAQLHVAASFEEEKIQPKCIHKSATILALSVFHMSVVSGFTSHFTLLCGV